MHENEVMTAAHLLSAAKRTALLSSVAAVLVLAGCSPTGSTPTTAPANDGSTGGGGNTCATFAAQTDPALKLMTSSAIASGPSEGQKYGDGTEFSVTLSQEAIDAGYLPQFELNTLDDNGVWVQLSSLNFDPTTGADGTYSTSTLEFGNDEYAGTPVAAQIFAISDNPIGDTVQYGDKVILGTYCITYENDAS
jgi:hypothetical protein